jgi:SAM-dependent methyltransferase
VIRRIKQALQPFRVYRGARFVWHFIGDPVFRRDHFLLWRRPARLYQHRSITLPDRYPAIFGFLQENMRDVSEPRLLSFGCATGEEVFALAGNLPKARIVGLDINPANIADARRRAGKATTKQRIEFHVANSASGQTAGAFNAVLCMAVFVRWQLRENRSVETSLPHLRFADFEKAMTELAACVAPGGHLVVRHSMFRFEDTAVARDFDCVLTLPTPDTFFPRFDRENRRLADSKEERVIFQKRSDGPTS